MFRRKIYDRLVQWKNESDGHTALLIEGARRVGKTTVVSRFAANEYETAIIIDFSTASPAIRALFDDLSDLDYFFLQLQLQFRTDLVKRRSLIVFDEVQLCPAARQAIKRLVADHRYDYIETGSLISIRRNVKDILIPSEERKIVMHPMDYEEFLWATGDTASYRLIERLHDLRRPLGEQTNRRLLRYFRLYMLVGGMPQAVAAYVDSNNFRKVDEAKRDILNLYEDDFMKIDPTGRLSLLFDSIPAQLSRNASRYQVGGVLGGSPGETETLTLIAEMRDSRTVLVSYHANDPNVGLAANKDLTRFKMFVGDTGLFTTLMSKDKDFTENIVYEKLLADKLPANLGYLYENVVAQILAAKGDELFYYTFMNETSKHNYEVDFLLSRGSKICPIEVKSSGYKAHTSLDRFCEKYPGRVGDRYLIYTRDYARDGAVTCLPVYMTPFL